jgi:hypothetical protein
MPQAEDGIEKRWLTAVKAPWRFPGHSIATGRPTDIPSQQRTVGRPRPAQFIRWYEPTNLTK